MMRHVPHEHLTTTEAMSPSRPNRRRASAASPLLKISHLSLVLLAYLLTLLFLYRQTQGIPLAVVLWATLLVALHVTGFYCAFRFGWNTRCAEPDLTLPQMAAALMILCAIAYFDSATQMALGPAVLVVFLYGAFNLSTLALAMLAAVFLSGYLLLMLGRADQNGYPPTFRLDLAQWFVLLVALPAIIATSSQIRKLRKVLEITRYQLEHFEEKASSDELTGLPNRRQLQIELEQARLRAALSAEPFCLCVLDIDHFKSVNDCSGHPAGDTVLCRFAQMARRSIRSSDILGRYGGDEFMKILPNTDLKGAVMHAERLRERAQRMDLAAVLPQRHISISIGVTQYRSGEDIAALIARADAALYRAKQSGRNRVEAQE